MSEVRMSLSEYNELKEKMDRQERILNAILTPTPVSEWDMQYHEEHPDHYFYTSSSPMEDLSYEDKEYLKSMIYRSASILAEKQFVSRGMAIMFELSPSFQLGYFKDIEDPKMAEEEDD